MTLRGFQRSPGSILKLICDKIKNSPAIFIPPNCSYRRLLQISEMRRIQRPPRLSYLLWLLLPSKKWKLTLARNHNYHPLPRITCISYHLRCVCSSNVLNIESASRVPVETNLAKTRICSLQAMLSV